LPEKSLSEIDSLSRFDSVKLGALSPIVAVDESPVQLIANDPRASRAGIITSKALILWLISNTRLILILN
jgi:hypothetical protein